MIVQRNSVSERRPSRGLVSAVSVLSLVAAMLVVQEAAAPPARAAADNGKVLILSTTVTNGTSSVEAQEAIADGYGVDLVDPTTWASMTQSQFAAYKAIILGDPTCGYGTSYITAAENNASTWGPIVTGNIEIVGTDPVFHSKPLVPQRGVDFAINSPAGTTGAYLDLSCYYDSVAANTPVPVLSGLPGSSTNGFLVQGVPCQDNIHIVAKSNALSGIDDAYLSNWSCSVHEAFDTWPERYGVLAIDTSTGAAYTANDGTVGDPYILAYPGGTVYTSTEQLSTNPSEPQTSTNCGKNPVNCATGNFWHTFNDVTIPGRGPALNLSRTYNSLVAATASPFGYGWSSTYTMSLSTDTAGDVTVHQENGSTVTFTPGSTAGTYSAPPRVFATLAQNSDGSYTFIRRKRDTFTFGASGQLTAIRDLNGYTTSLAYNTNGQLASVTDPAGRALTFAYGSNGLVSSVTDPANRKISYSYDSAGNLTSVTNPAGGVETFSYDSNHLLLTMTDPNGGKVSNVYDATGRVTSQTDAMNRTLAFAYSDAGTTITDPNGNQTVEDYTQGRLISLTKGYGTSSAATWTYAYDSATFEVTAVIDPDGHTTAYTYDSNGNRTSATDALNRKTATTYNAFNEPTSVTDPSGITTSYTYDASGNLLTKSRSLSSTGQTQATSLTYGDSAHPGDVTSLTDPNGKTWSFAYDPAGDLASITDPLGDKTSYSYDTIGRRISSTSARGKVTTYTYDALGDLTKTTDPLGHVTTRAYDPNRNLISVTDPDGKTTTYSYDADNEQTTVARADGTKLTYAYDANGNQTAQADAAGHTTAYTYDPLNRVVSTTDPLARVTHYTYDPAGNRTSLTDAAGNVTTSGYDAGNELTSISYSDGTTPDVTLTYTADGQRASMADGTGTTSYTYDSLNRLIGQTDGAGSTVHYAYDLDGHLTGLTYPNSKTVTRTYDAAGRLVAITDWLGHTTTFSPDADGNTTTTTYGNGVVASQTFNAADQLTSITDTSGGATLTSFAYTRDANGQLTSTTPTGVTQGNESYSYTQLNQLAGINTSTYSYDPAGNLTKLTDGSSLTYDAASQATKYTPATGTPTTFTYDSRGNRLNGVAPSGTAVSYTYDQANRLTGATGGTTSSAAGLIAGGEYHSLAAKSDGSVWAWGYNAYGQLGNGTTTNSTTPVHVPLSATASQVAAGDLSSAAMTSSGTVDTWGYNAFGQLGNGTTSNSTTPVPVSGLAGVTAIAAGSYHMLALKADGTVVAWGLNNADQLGDGTATNRTTPVTVQGLSNVVGIAAGGLPGYAGQSVALKSDGTVWVWGYGKSGQLGLGSNASTGTPTQVPGLTNITQIAANGDNTYALRSDGTVWAWGDNAYGQIGNTAAGHTQNTPLQVNITGAKHIGAGGTHALAIKSDGTAWAWGDDNTGQLGDGGACGKTCETPVQVTGLTGAVAITGGYVHSLAVLSDGTVNAWGRNAEGELGDGTTTVRTTPVAVSGLAGVKPAPLIHDSYTYNGDGLRATRLSAGGVTQHFSWNSVGGVPTMLTDGTISYLYDDSGTPIEQVDTSGMTVFYQHDQYGSTRLLSDSAGSVVATFSYDPYGILTGKSGASDTPLLWNGQYEDSDTGLYFLRARYYDPSLGQFISSDPLSPLTHDPYGYAGDNPLMGMDPTGLIDGWQILAAAGLVAGGVALIVATGGLGGVVAAGYLTTDAVVAIGTGAEAASGVVAAVSTVHDCASQGQSLACVLDIASLGTFGAGRLAARAADPLAESFAKGFDATSLLFGGSALAAGFVESPETGPLSAKMPLVQDACP